MSMMTGLLIIYGVVYQTAVSSDSFQLLKVVSHMGNLFLYGLVICYNSSVIYYNKHTHNGARTRTRMCVCVCV